MKKHLLVTLFIGIIIGLSFLIKYINDNKIEQEKARQMEQEIEETIKQARKERYVEFLVMEDIFNNYKYKKVEYEKLTSEKRKNINFEKEFADELIGKKIKLYAKVDDIIEIKGHRIIQITDGINSLLFNTYIYDDYRKVNDLNRGDKIDIIITAEKYFYEKNLIKENILCIQFKVDKMIKRYGQYDFPSINNVKIDDRF